MEWRENQDVPFSWHVEKMRLVGKVIAVSMETVRLVSELAQTVMQEDWMREIK